MKFATIPAAALLCAGPCLATHSHRHVHNQFGKRHTHSHFHSRFEGAEEPALQKRTTCSLPSDPDLYAVPGAMNGGFAMSPDVSCTPGMYCPLACVPGKVMAQWQPGTTYVYPESMNGGLLCGSDGTPSKPFPDSPYCVEGTGTVSAVNDCGSVVSFCQTVLPGDESMLIPTDVGPGATVTLAVPGISYWDSTAAHYYVNPPGTPGSTGCVWGVDTNPIGNWAPYVAGANTDANGLTYVKIAWNPVWIASGLVSQTPDYGLKIECPAGGCNGLPCSIDPSTNPVNTVQSPVSTVGVGGASFCVVTVPSGGTANIVVFPVGGAAAANTSTAAPPSTSTAAKSSAAASTSSASPSSAATSSHPHQEEPPEPSLIPGIFHENSSSSAVPSLDITSSASLSSATDTANASSTSTKSDAVSIDQGGAAVVGLIVALVAAAWLY